MRAGARVLDDPEGEVLQNLVDVSLLTLRIGRIHHLPLIHAHAEERLTERRDCDEVRERHAANYGEWADELVNSFYQDGVDQRFFGSNPEVGNFRAALEHDPTHPAIRRIAANDELAHGHPWRALTHLRGLTDGVAAIMAAVAHQQLGEVDVAIAGLKQALTHTQGILRLRVSQGLLQVTTHRGSALEQIDLLETVIKQSRTLGVDKWRTQLMAVTVFTQVLDGDRALSEARAVFEEGPPELERPAAVRLGRSLVHSGDLLGARALLERAQEKAQTTPERASAQIALALAVSRGGNPSEGHGLLSTLLEGGQLPARHRCGIETELARNHLRLGHVDQATTVAHAHLDSKDDNVRMWATLVISEGLMRQEQAKEAKEHLDALWAVSKRSGGRRLAWTGLSLAAWHRRFGSTRKGLEVLEEVEAAIRSGVPMLRICIAVERGWLMLRDGQRSRAVGQVADAERVFATTTFAAESDAAQRIAALRLALG